MRGTVTSFDDPRGLGEIAGSDGIVYPFHCTQIAHGTRHIAVRSAVEFQILAGHLGRFEATAISLRP